MSRGYWRSVQDEVEEAFAAAETRDMCLCVKSDRTKRLLDRRAEAGTVVAPFPHVYARDSYWRSLSPGAQALQVVRAAAALHPAWVFCGTSAAIAHGLQVSEPEPSVVHILDTKGGKGHQSKHVARHRLHADDSEKFDVVAGVKATPLDRTIADCLRTLSMPAGLAVADSALRDYGLTREDLVGFVRAQSRVRGSQQAIQTIGWADGRSENGGESVARGIMIELGFCVPELQVLVEDPSHPGCEFRVDYVWETGVARPIFGELDGAAKYADRGAAGEKISGKALLAERRRESRLTLCNASIMRFSFEEAKNRPFFRVLLERYGVPRRVVPAEMPRDFAV